MNLSSEALVAVTPGRTRLFSLIALLAGLVCAPAALAVTCTTNNLAGNWNAPGTWSGCTGGNGTPANTPGTNDDVVIANFARTYTVTANAAANSITFQAGGTTTTLTINAGITLAVGTGGVTVNAPTGGNRKRIDLTAGATVFSVNGDVALNGGTAGNTAEIRLGSNAGTTVTITANATPGTGNLTPNGATALVTFSGAGTLNVAGNFASGATLAGGTGTVVYDGSGAGTVGSYTTYNNLTVNKTTATGIATTTAGSVTVGGTLNVSGGTLELAGTTVGVTGTTTIAGGAAAGGTLKVTSATGAKSFAAMTINAGTVPGVFDNSTANDDIAMSGTLTNGGTFTSGTGTYTFTGTANWTGANAITFSGNVILNTNTRTNAMTGGTPPVTTIVGNLSGTGTISNGASQTLKIGGNATLTGLTGTAPNIIEYNGTAGQTGKAGGTAQYDELVISSAGTVAFGGSISISGDLSDNGKFSHTSGTVTFNGTAAQNLINTGTAATTTFVNLTLNNTAGVATRQLILDHNIVVTTLLTLTAGRITTGAANDVYISNGTAITSAGGNDFVEGNLRKPYSGAGLSRVFEVGNFNATAAANKYTPATLAFAAVSVAGDITMSTANADHPQFASSGLDPANHVNRYWTMSKDLALTFTTYTLTLNYIAGAPAAGDIDATATVAAFVAPRYDGSAWNGTTLNATPTTTQLVVTGVTAVGDFAIGEATGYNATLGRFNAFDTAGAIAGATQGYIKTKISGLAFNSAPTSTTLTVVHLTTGALASFGVATTVTVDIIDGTTTTAPFVAASNCWTNWTTAPAIATGTINFTAAQTSGTINLTVPNAYKNLRVRMSAGAQMGCSADAFAVRPNTFTSVAVTDQDWQTAGSTRTLSNVAATGGAVHKAGQPFRIVATAQNAAAATTTLYFGAPTPVPLALVQPTLASCATCVVGTATPGSWSPSTAGTATGTVTTTTASYSEVGSFTMRLEDRNWADVDRADSTTAQRYVVGATFNVGRFVPDHFVVTTASTPVLQTFGTNDTSCQTPPVLPKRSFTYIGQSFGYTTVPVATFTAQNAANATTLNYSGSVFPSASITATQTYTPAPATLSAVVNTPTIAAGASASGTGTVTVNAADKLAYVRDTAAPQNVFNAVISLTVNVSDPTEAGANQGTITTTTSTAFSSIGFDSGDLFRYGRLRLQNGIGSELADLSIPIVAQYWNNSAFVTNAEDHCTTLSAANLTLGAYKGGINSTNLAAPGHISLSPFVSGVGGLKITKPSPVPASPGSATVTVNLGAELKAYLQGNWGVSTYTVNPSARAGFGLFSSQPRNFIFYRENY